MSEFTGSKVRVGGNETIRRAHVHIYEQNEIAGGQTKEKNGSEKESGSDWPTEEEAARKTDDKRRRRHTARTVGSLVLLPRHHWKSDSAFIFDMVRTMSTL